MHYIQSRFREQKTVQQEDLNHYKERKCILKNPLIENLYTTENKANGASVINNKLFLINFHHFSMYEKSDQQTDQRAPS